MTRPKRIARNAPTCLEDIIGRQVYLIGDHPWAGKAGEVTGFDEGLGSRVRIDIGGIGGEMEVGVTSPKQFMALPELPHQRLQRITRKGEEE